MNSSANQVRYKARFHHTGAMINEMRTLIQHYDSHESKGDWIDKITQNNVLAKNSRGWLRELILGSFFPRYVDGVYPNVFRYIDFLEKKKVPFNIIKSIMYYHTALSDEFLYEYITCRLFEQYFSGRLIISARDVYEYIESVPPEKFNKPWSDYVKRRLSRGVLATLRDFEILEGKAHKKIANYFLPLETFVYVAFLLKQRYQSGDKIVRHKDWRLFLLMEKHVDRLFLKAHQENYLIYQAAGGIIRIEFLLPKMEELLNVIAERTA